MKHLFINIQFLILILLFSSFQSDRKEIPVRIAGALQTIMRAGDISAKIDLDTLKKSKLYALGALENLKGEIMVIKGKPVISRVNESGVEIEKDMDVKGSVLVYSYVRKWREYVIPSEIRNFQNLETYIGTFAAELGIDTSKPFPFLIEGRPISVHWHVINWKDGDVIHTPEKHRNSGAQPIVFEGFIKALGFYSENHQGIISHHDSKMHIHFRDKRSKMAGHVDDIKMVGNMKLYLPDLKKIK